MIKKLIKLRELGTTLILLDSHNIGLYYNNQDTSDNKRLICKFYIDGCNEGVRVRQLTVLEEGIRVPVVITVDEDIPHYWTDLLGDRRSVTETLELVIQECFNHSKVYFKINNFMELNYGPYADYDSPYCIRMDELGL